MTSGLHGTAQHPLESLVCGVAEVIEEYADSPAWTLTPVRLVELLPDLAVAKRRLEALELRLLREADRHQVGDPIGCANTAAWWANATRTTKTSAHRQVRLAEQFDRDEHTTTAEAMSGGAVSVDQAAVIVNAIDKLPSDLVTAKQRLDAEAHLVELAEHHDPKDLRILGKKILEVIAPEVAEEHERRELEREEQHANATAMLVVRRDGKGSMYGRFKVPVLAGEILVKHLNANAAPRHQAANSPVVEEVAQQPSRNQRPRVARPLRMGQAFVEYLETRDQQGTPKAGGVAATVVVTMTLENLLGTSEHGALLDTGELISASEARRLACEAGIIPAVLGGKSQILDLGRKRRFHTETQRIALGIRDGGCSAEGCDWPPGMCHAHHDVWWSRGGGTSVDEGRLLCPNHHGLAHDSRYQMKAGKDGKVRFTTRT